MRTTLKLSSFLLAVFICLQITAAVFLPASAAEGPLARIVAASDAQSSGGDLENVSVLRLMNTHIKNSFQGTVNGYIFAGDYSAKDASAVTAADTAASVAALKDAVTKDFPDVTADKMLFVKGEHDAAGADGLSAGGAHEFDSYIVYVINDDDFAWDAENPDANPASERLKEYLAERIAASDKRPVFIASHRPLHYSMRTYNDADNLYADRIFEVLNNAGAHGLNIFYIFGHNHDNGWDACLGHSCVYLGKGDRINVPSPYDKRTFLRRTLNFTYLNAGYLSSVSRSDNGDNSVTVTVYDIYSDRVEINRVSESGRIHNLKCPGGYNAALKEEANLKSKGFAPDTRTIASPACVALTPVVQEVPRAALPDLDGQSSRTNEEIYPGVNASNYYLAEGSKFGGNGPQFLRVVEFDPTQKGLALDVVPAGSACDEKATVSDIVKRFNATNNENKTAIAAVNGDLWMTAQFHSRVEGSGVACGGYSNAVVKAELCVPRGYVVVDGEIICSQNMTTETPFDERYQSMGIAADGTPLLGDINTKLYFSNNTKGTSRRLINGLNRLPADGALVLYSDKGPVSNYALDDAYEVVVDCDYDYRVFDGETITGTVTAISRPGEERYQMKENRLIFTARGKSPINRISGMEIGDEISVSVSIEDAYGNTAAWRTVTEAVGGHLPPVRGGLDTNTSTNRADPMTIIGFKSDGTIVMIVNDGRQEGYSIGINRTLFDELCCDLDIDSAMLLDGGGSTTLVELTEQGYALKNRPSDLAGATSGGVERPVVNAVILSYISDKPEEPEKIAGDVNGDGKLTLLDILLLRKALSGTTELTEIQYAAADVNKDGKITARDTTAVRRILAGLE